MHKTLKYEWKILTGQNLGYDKSQAFNFTGTVFFYQPPDYQEDMNHTKIRNNKLN